ncbi:MAG: SAM-dependent methyltransferase [Steroidobacteraceae bacterium]
MTVTTRLHALIAERIAAAGGWLGFDEFMRLALYAPGLGYYSAGSYKLGAGGDFTTAPETSPLFADGVATQCAQLLAELGPQAELFEVGAGSGALACDVLRALERAGRLPARYRILEVSADLRERQQHAVRSLPPQLSGLVQWLDEPPSHPWQGVLLANELLDALPCERFSVAADGEFVALGVALEAGELVWRGVDADQGLRAELQRIVAELPQPLPRGYNSELCRLVEPWLGSVSDALTRGALLLFDYGLPRRELYHLQRDDGTLHCHFQHQAHGDPFANLGLQDITAWVDFTRVAEGADALGLQVNGFATQAAFLLGTGIEARIAAASDARARAQLASAARKLMLPGEMGEIFKVIALTRDVDIALAGFAHQDLRARL